MVLFENRLILYYYISADDALIIEWQNMHLNDQEDGKFIFWLILLLILLRCVSQVLAVHVEGC